MDLEKHLKDQVEAILDTNDELRQEVIVRTDAPEPPDPAILPGIRDGVLRRSLSTNARDLLPASASASAVGPTDSLLSRVQRSELTRSDKSLSVWLAPQVITTVTTKIPKKVGLDALQPLLESEIVQAAIAAVAETAIKSATKGANQTKPADKPFVPIWASNTAVLTLDRDQIKTLPLSVPGIQDIHLNSRLFVPPMVSPQQLPSAVTNNEACAWRLATTGALAAWAPGRLRRAR